MTGFWSSPAFSSVCLSVQPSGVTILFVCFSSLVNIFGALVSVLVGTYSVLNILVSPTALQCTRTYMHTCWWSCVGILFDRSAVDWVARWVFASVGRREDCQELFLLL